EAHVHPLLFESGPVALENRTSKLLPALNEGGVEMADAPKIEEGHLAGQEQEVPRMRICIEAPMSEDRLEGELEDDRAGTVLLVLGGAVPKCLEPFTFNPLGRQNAP